MKYVLDANLYIRAFRNEADARELEAFYAAFVPVTYLSSIVVHELLVGATTPAKARDIRDEIALLAHYSARVGLSRRVMWRGTCLETRLPGWYEAGIGSSAHFRSRGSMTTCSRHPAESQARR